jgi:hypothetical protein
MRSLGRVTAGPQADRQPDQLPDQSEIDSRGLAKPSNGSERAPSLTDLRPRGPRPPPILGFILHHVAGLPGASLPGGRDFAISLRSQDAKITAPPVRSRVPHSTGRRRDAGGRHAPFAIASGQTIHPPASRLIAPCDFFVPPRAR